MTPHPMDMYTLVIVKNRCNVVKMVPEEENGRGKV
jgi:hypothetical protein